jgi:hypothetical protein
VAAPSGIVGPAALVTKLWVFQRAAIELRQVRAVVERDQVGGGKKPAGRTA